MKKIFIGTVEKKAAKEQKKQDSLLSKKKSPQLPPEVKGRYRDTQTVEEEETAKSLDSPNVGGGVTNQSTILKGSYILRLENEAG